MDARDLALEFVRRFCAGDVEGLAPLLADDLHLAGPLFRFASRAAYLDALRQDPPRPASHRVISVTVSDDEVAIFYEYDKGARPLTIGQLCTIDGGLIRRVLLVFDGRDQV